MERPHRTAFALMLVGCAPDPGRVDDPIMLPPPVGYNQVAQKSAHNAYQRDEPLLDQIRYHRVHSLELDLHVGKGADYPPDGEDQDWYVYHQFSFFGDDLDTHCHRLSDCLKLLRAFHDANPQHEVITVWLDLKDGWRDANHHRPRDLDARIAAHISPSTIIEPQDLLAACPGALSLEDAVTNTAGANLRADGCAWPRVAGGAGTQTRGKFFFVFTGDGDAQDTYVHEDATTVAAVRSAGGPMEAFTSVEIDSASDVAPVMAARPWTVFFNSPLSASGTFDQAREVRDRGFVSRIYPDVDWTSSDWTAALSRVNHLATNNVNADSGTPFARTHTTRGYPFACLDPALCDTEAEGWLDAVHVVTTALTSGDIGGATDNFHFHFQSPSTANLHRWIVGVGAESSHLNDEGKGCLMARASTSANAPFYAVCRLAEDNAVRVLFRTATGGPTTSVVADIAPQQSNIWGDLQDAIWEEDITFLLLEVEAGATAATGFASMDGSTFIAITPRQTFQNPLVRQGLATAAAGNSDRVRFVFENARVDQSGFTMASFTHAAIGTPAPSSPAPGAGIFDGYANW